MIFASRLAPFFLEVFPEVETLKFGLNRRLRHDPIWNGLEIAAVAPCALNAVPENDIGLQFVGLNMNPGRSTTASIVRRSVGTPSITCGNGSVVTVICAVKGSTSILARRICVCNVNGPTTT